MRRQTILMGNAARWRDRVCADMLNVAAMSEHQVAVDDVAAVVDGIASYIAAGEVVIKMSRRRWRCLRYLDARGHIERLQGDLIKPVGVREGELIG